MNDDVDNPEYRDIFREVIKETLDQYNEDPDALDSDWHTIILNAKQHYASENKILDYLMAINMAIIQANKQGHSLGEVSNQIIFKWCEKYEVMDAILVEMVLSDVDSQLFEKKGNEKKK